MVDYKKIHNSYQTIIEILNDRKYITKSVKMTYDDWFAKYKVCINSDKIHYLCKIIYIDDKKQKGGVLWSKIAKIGVTELTYFTKIANEWKSYILVCQIPPTNQTHKEIVQNLRFVYGVEYFILDELQINITKHKYVPKHEKLSKEEKEKLLEIYNVEPTKFPLIQNTDPVSKYYKFEPGDMIRIRRNNVEISYRYVIKAD